MNDLSTLLLLCSLLFLPQGLCAAADAPSQKSRLSAIGHESATMETADTAQNVPFLIRRGEAYRMSGHLREAQRDLEKALTGAQAAKTEVLEAVARYALGSLLFQQQKDAAAQAELLSAKEMAERLQKPQLAAAAANALGGVYARRNLHERAAIAYRDALKAAKEADDAGMIVAASLNLSRMAGASQPEQLEEARIAALKIPDRRERAELLLKIAKTASLNGGKSMRLFANGLLREVLNITGATAAPRLHSLANGELGALYEQEGRSVEALLMTERAIMDAQQISSDALLLKWQWQLGRLYEASKDRARAIAAYRRAIYHLEAIRTDIPVTYQSGQSSFRKTMAPIYYGLAELLLRQAAEEKPEDQERVQALLSEARDTVEKIKLSEMQDYFQDQCVTGQTKQIESLSSRNAVLYPIVLDDRLEILVGIGSRLSRYTVNVPRDALVASAQQLVKTLRPRQSGRLLPFDAQTSQKLYAWLIEPVVPLLERHGIDTLVFVPDGVLRLFPIAALWDGHRFLVEKYAIATVPGLTLLDPRPLAQKETNALLAGLSRPGPVVDELSDTLRDNLIAVPLSEKSRAIRGMPINTRELRITKSEPSRPVSQKSVTEQIQNALALPGVKEEIDVLSTILENQMLLDSGFLLKDFSTRTAQNPYRIIHIASHGFFGETPDQNFIMAYDHKLDMDSLSAMLKPKQFSEHPVELLTLSACQTAEGDDRSPLGLSGVALKSGARSALGSIWPVSDDATKMMLPIFYKRLLTPGTTKAGALQAAQIEVLRKKEYAHPFYWSAFILIGNWL